MNITNSYCFPACVNGDTRLVNGSAPSNGRLEVCWNGQWGTVCDDQFNNLAAQVVCNQLNYSTSGLLLLINYYEIPTYDATA